jgi:predicted DNA-binding transcriptional regulator AlpA
MTDKPHELRPEPELLDIRAVAALLSCSARHVLRLRDGGKMPEPVHLGHAVRWRRAEILDWIASGCPPIRRVSGALVARGA